MNIKSFIIKYIIFPPHSRKKYIYIYIYILVNKTDETLLKTGGGLISTDLVYYKYLIGRSWKIINS